MNRDLIRLAPSMAFLGASITALAFDFGYGFTAVLLFLSALTLP